MSPTVIEIDRVPLTFVAATTTDRAALLSRRMSEAITRALPSALEHAVPPDLEDENARVFIDRLDVDCLVAAQWDDDAVAGPLAAAIAGAMQREIQLGNALVFRDRVEFLSAYLLAVADGRAIARWWFDEFDGLAALPASACLRTVIADEGAAGWEALARLSLDSLVQVVSAIASADALLILADVDGRADRTAVEAPRLIEALESAAAVSLPTRSHRLILALAILERKVAGTASSRTLAALRGVASLIDAARSGRLSAPADRSAATVRAWCDVAGIDHAERAAVSDLDAAPLIDLVAAKMTAPAAGDAADAADESIRIHATRRRLAALCRARAVGLVDGLARCAPGCGPR